MHPLLLLLHLAPSASCQQQQVLLQGTQMHCVSLQDSLQ
jgi:hypothetical protein